MTNALNGWYDEKQKTLHLRQFEKERDRAKRVKQKLPILVILGNPPYNTYSKSDGSDNNLLDPYKDGLTNKKIWNVGNPHGIEDSYVKFIRVAERKIDETGAGVVCYITNYSYISGDSYVAMRKHLIGVFDKIWIDSLNGSLQKNNMKTPDGKNDESVFKTEYSGGISTGTSIGLFVKKSRGGVGCEVKIREFWGEGKRERLLSSLNAVNFDEQYEETKPEEWNRFIYSESTKDEIYLSWPTIMDFPKANGKKRRHVTGVVESRGGALFDIDREVLEDRMRVYFDTSKEYDEFHLLDHELDRSFYNYDPREKREEVLKKAKEKYDDNNMVRYLISPFDVRWAYHTETSGVWARKQDAFRPHMKHNDGFLVTRRKKSCEVEGFPVLFTRCLGSNDMAYGHSWYLPFRSRAPKEVDTLDWIDSSDNANLSQSAKDWLASLGIENMNDDARGRDIPWLHILAITWSPAYISDNAVNLEVGWPRIPMPRSSEVARASAELGQRVMELLDTENDVDGVTSGGVDIHLSIIGRVDGDDFDLSLGRDTRQREWTASECDALEAGFENIGIETERGFEILGPAVDVAMNTTTFWRGIPKSVWECRVGGHLPLANWISTRKRLRKGKELTSSDLEEIVGVIRRLAALILMTDSLDSNYEACRRDTYSWYASEPE